MITPTISLCQAAIGLAGLSITLQLAAAIARSRTSIHMDEPAEPPVAEPVVITAPAPALHARPSPKLSRLELLEHARALGVKNARWRNSAKKVDLVLAIREHNQQREASHA